MTNIVGDGSQYAAVELDAEDAVGKDGEIVGKASQGADNSRYPVLTALLLDDEIR